MSSIAAFFLAYFLTTVSAGPKKEPVNYTRVYKFLVSLGENLHELSKPDQRPGEHMMSYSPILGASETGTRYVGTNEAVSALQFVMKQGWGDVLEEWSMLKTYCTWKKQHPNPEDADPDDQILEWENQAKAAPKIKHRAGFCDMVVLVGCNFLVPQENPAITATANTFLHEAGQMLYRQQLKYRSSKRAIDFANGKSFGTAIFDWSAIVDACQEVYKGPEAGNEFKKITCTALNVPLL